MAHIIQYIHHIMQHCMHISMHVYSVVIVEQFVRSPESKIALWGESVQFFCIQDRSLPLAEIVWLKDGMLLPVSSSDRYLVQSQELLHNVGRVSSSLLIIPVRSSDAGLYSCRAINPLLPSNLVYSNNATLTVEGMWHLYTKPLHKLYVVKRPICCVTHGYRLYCYLSSTHALYLLA